MNTYLRRKKNEKTGVTNRMKPKYLGILLAVGLTVLMGIGIYYFLQKSHPPTPPSQQRALTEERPLAPKGYTWQECTPMKAAFLKPQGWFFKEQGKDGMEACFISKEEIAGPKGEFETGLSVNAIKNVSKRTGMSPTTFVENFFSIDKQAGIKHRGKLIDLSMGLFKGYGQLIESQQPGEGSITQYTVVLGNDTTGSVYIIWFESPSAIWGENWNIGKPIMEILAVDDEF